MVDRIAPARLPDDLLVRDSGIRFSRRAAVGPNSMMPPPSTEIPGLASRNSRLRGEPIGQVEVVGVEPRDPGRVRPRRERLVEVMMQPARTVLRTSRAPASRHSARPPVERRRKRAVRRDQHLRGPQAGARRCVSIACTEVRPGRRRPNGHKTAEGQPASPVAGSTGPSSRPHRGPGRRVASGRSLADRADAEDVPSRRAPARPGRCAAVIWSAW